VQGSLQRTGGKRDDDPERKKDGGRGSEEKKADIYTGKEKARRTEVRGADGRVTGSNINIKLQKSRKKRRSTKRGKGRKIQTCGIKF